ncbi:hypothetical protein A1Q2_03740 [Trichosporon asahii var. asahii CBS 8904]|uniref:Uncharacterized protein n=1 Tax=Trichosporon asahii var. asahii (strain CBS 8904) TaxID=1220162 RepID=K1VDI1_TRIAC|nr:hypothetical protein A1Q2_03740 [Trichosporon asahii var. asahii CBS 8904]
MGRLTTDTSGMEGDIWGSLGDGVEGWSRVMDNGRVLDVLGVDELRRLMDDVGDGRKGNEQQVKLGGWNDGTKRTLSGASLSRAVEEATGAIVSTRLVLGVRNRAREGLDTVLLRADLGGILALAEVPQLSIAPALDVRLEELLECRGEVSQVLGQILRPVRVKVEPNDRGADPEHVRRQNQVAEHPDVATDGLNHQLARKTQHVAHGHPAAARPVAVAPDALRRRAVVHELVGADVAHDGVVEEHHAGRAVERRQCVSPRERGQSGVAPDHDGGAHKEEHQHHGPRDVVDEQVQHARVHDVLRDWGQRRNGHPLRRRVDVHEVAERAQHRAVARAQGVDRTPIAAGEHLARRHADVVRDTTLRELAPLAVDAHCQESCGRGGSENGVDDVSVVRLVDQGALVGHRYLMEESAGDGSLVCPSEGEWTGTYGYTAVRSLRHRDCLRDPSHTSLETRASDCAVVRVDVELCITDFSAVILQRQEAGTDWVKHVDVTKLAVVDVLQDAVLDATDVRMLRLKVGKVEVDDCRWNAVEVPGEDKVDEKSHLTAQQHLTGIVDLRARRMHVPRVDNKCEAEHVTEAHPVEA